MSGLSTPWRRLRGAAARRVPTELRLIARRLPEALAHGPRAVGQGAAFYLKQARFVRALRRPVRQAVLYESFGGAGLLCNPEAIFRALLAADDLRHLEHVWAVKDVPAARRRLGELPDGARVRLVEYQSGAYWEAVESCRYLVNNATFPPSFVKRPDQTYLNTWHGTPLKAMGYHMPGGALEAHNIVRNFLSADYLLSQGPQMTEQMYRDGYRLDNVFTGAVIEEGYPRVDRQGPGSREELTVRLAGAGIDIAGRRVVLYAPTWRGDSFHRPQADVARLSATVRRLEEVTGAGTVVLLKAHQAVADQVGADPYLRSRQVPNDVATNVALGGSDVLVSDYSSIFFDFLPTHRPVFFHVPDVEDYGRERGLYLRPDELPGPVSNTLDVLAEQLADYRQTGRTGFEDAVVAAAHRFTPWDDGAAAERVVDIVFRGRTDGYRLRRDLADGRETLAIYLGQLLTNGITTSALNLLQTIDHDRYDVTAVFPWTVDETKRANAALIPPQVRQLPRRAGLTRMSLHAANARFSRAVRAGEPVDWTREAGLWGLEWRRVFGQGRFDRVVDFSGYSPYWASILLGGGRPVVFWQHNDLAADAEREVDGVRRLRDDLHATFRLYPRFAALVSVSPALAEVNRRQLARYAGGTPFLSVRNSVDADRVRAAAVEPVADPALEQVGTGSCTYVCVGRLSPEKNHARLLTAFARVHAAEPGARLVIIGDGPLRPAIEAQVEQLGLDEAVLLTGSLANPWQLMARCDCHVVASDYEGQPMVILEARMLGLPVISTRFGSAAAAVPPGAGRLVDLDADALAEAMLQQCRHPLVPEPFDAEAYNAEVRAEFDRAVQREG